MTPVSERRNQMGFRVPGAQQKHKKDESQMTLVRRFRTEPRRRLSAHNKSGGRALPEAWNPNNRNLILMTRSGTRLTGHPQIIPC